MVRPDRLDVLDLGRISYDQAYQKQLEIHQAVLDNRRCDTVLLVEHDAVITVSRRRHAGKNLLAAPDQLAKMGIQLRETDRGGDVTYHGPGQLVVYPIVKLQTRGLNVRRYVCALEQSVMDTLAVFSVQGRRLKGKPGIWVSVPEGSGFSDTPAPPGPSSLGPSSLASSSGGKLAAIGVRIKRNVTMHGLALNVTTDLAHFDLIVPCGLSDCRAVSMASILGPDTPSMNQVKGAMTEALARNLKIKRNRVNDGGIDGGADGAGDDRD